VGVQRADKLHGLGGLGSAHGEIFASHRPWLPGNCGVLSIGVIRTDRLPRLNC
jgi:hypothetical protein